MNAQEFVALARSRHDQRRLLLDGLVGLHPGLFHQQPHPGAGSIISSCSMPFFWDSTA